MPTRGKAVAVAGGKRGLLPGGKAAVFNAAGACPACCGAVADCSACAGDTISIVISYEGTCSQAQCKDRLSPTTRTAYGSLNCVWEAYFYYGYFDLWLDEGQFPYAGYESCVPGRWYCKINRTFNPPTGFGSGDGEQPMDVTAYVTCASGQLIGAFTLTGYGDCAGCLAHVTIT